MAWNGKDREAVTFVKRLRSKPSVAADLKVVCMEVVHTVNTERDLKMLLSALAYTDRAECENKHILKCRLHRRIAGLHYRNGDIEEADEHLVTALQLAKQMSPDIDSVYTFRLLQKEEATLPSRLPTKITEAPATKNTKRNRQRVQTR